VTNERVLLISPDEEGAARHPDSYRMSGNQPNCGEPTIQQCGLTVALP
jgi:hypothetical protein